jgi:hypothetical protein
VIDRGAYYHDKGYVFKGADGIHGALFDLNVLDYDRQLYYTAQSTYFKYFLGAKDDVTNRPISLQTAGRAWAVSLAFGPIVIGKTIAKGTQSRYEELNSFVKEFGYSTNHFFNSLKPNNF